MKKAWANASGLRQFNITDIIKIAVAVRSNFYNICYVNALRMIGSRLCLTLRFFLSMLMYLVAA
jgi:hypothetical protein